MLNKLKVFLDISIDDNKMDEKLDLIIAGATARLKNMLGGIEPPEELSYVILDASVIRFNRIGSEGMTSHSVEGENLSFSNDDFAAYKEDIQAWLEKQKESNRGKVRFL